MLDNNVAQAAVGKYAAVSGEAIYKYVHMFISYTCVIYIYLNIQVYTDIYAHIYTYVFMYINIYIY
jgi:hypothetical protein